MVARNPSYKPVVLRDPVSMGFITRVRVVEAMRGYLVGETV
jgi:hypothetical protein